MSNNGITLDADDELVAQLVTDAIDWSVVGGCCTRGGHGMAVRL